MSEVYDLMNSEVQSHNVYGIHIQNRNDALSDKRPHICIGWSSLGDLSDISTKDDLISRYKERIPEGEKNSRSCSQDVTQIWSFLKNIQIGDYIIFSEVAKCHIGIIESDYYYDNNHYVSQDPDYVNVRNVKWIRKNILRADIPQELNSSLKAGRSLWNLNEHKVSVQLLLNGASFQKSIKYKNKYSSYLISSKNLILRGAPGTGKTYLAKDIAADIISCGQKDYLHLSLEEKEQIDFVQFHPSYDYTDFVEGLRPVENADHSIVFTYRDGIFKSFVNKAKKRLDEFYNNVIKDFLSTESPNTVFKIKNGNSYKIISYDELDIKISIEENSKSKLRSASINNIKKLLEFGVDIKFVKDVQYFSNRSYRSYDDSFEYAIYKEIKLRMNSLDIQFPSFVFIIDEINRGEISKIFGELFYSIDPDYRGPAGEITTQYSNLHKDPSIKFYVPRNVYIIGTMNDIDRSVDSFDFAMRRRFRFVEIKPDERMEILFGLDNEFQQDEAEARLNNLNTIISDKFGEDYQIGPAYFLKLNDLNKDVLDVKLAYDQLWEDYIKPLLQEYVRGMGDENADMDVFYKGYCDTTLKDNNDGNAK